MQIQDFVRVYQAKSDEELVELADARERLTSEARLALEGELSRRRITIGGDPRASQSDGAWHDPGRTAASEKFQTGEQQGVGDFVAEVLRTYHSSFWLFFRITAPAVILSTIVIITGRNEGREIARHLPPGVEMLAHRMEIVEIWLTNVSAYFLSWMAFSFCYGAICIAVEEIAAGFTPSAWQCLLNMREQLGRFLRLSLLLFVLLLVAEAFSTLLATGVFWIFHQWQAHLSRFVIAAISYVVVGLAVLVLSRFALAVPAVILDDFKVGRALFRSDQLTQGKWMVLAALLAKSLIGGYVAAMWPFWLASFVRLPAAFGLPWLLTALSVLSVTVVEPVIFVGFALLYLKKSNANSASNEALSTQLA